MIEEAEYEEEKFSILFLNFIIDMVFNHVLSVFNSFGLCRNPFFS